MIGTYKHISDQVHVLGVRPVVFVVLLVTVVLLVAFELLLLAIVVVGVGYKYARNYRDTKLSFIDLVFYATTSRAYSVLSESVGEDK